MSTNPIMKKAFFTTGGGGGTTLPTYETGKFLTNDGTNLSWAANGAGDLKADGTVPLTANWAAGAFDISAQTLTTTETLAAETVSAMSGWTATSGWTYGTGKWTHSTGTTELEDDITNPAYTAGASYKLVVSITHAGTGSVDVRKVNQQLGVVSASGTYTYYFSAIGDSEDSLQFVPTTGWTGSIDSVSIKKVTGNYITSGNCVFGPDQIVVPHSTLYYPAIAFGAYNSFGVSSSPERLSLYASSGYGLSIYTDGYSRFTSILNNATGNEGAFQIWYETNKATSGADYGLYIRKTEASSPGTSYLIKAEVLDVGDKFLVEDTGAVTGLSFALSGTGTLASTAGNATFTTSLTAASGDEVGLLLQTTVNKAGGNYTALKVNATETAAPGTSDLLADFQVGGVTKFSVTNGGAVTTAGNVTLPSAGTLTAGKIVPAPYNSEFLMYVDGSSSATNGFKILHNPANVKTSGSFSALNIAPSYNQASGTAANTDLLINRTETAVGSGTQRLISAQVGSTERVGFDNKGFETRAYPKTCTHDTATALFGITVAAGSTTGGVITYTLNVTDDDGSDDQIEVGTVQFCGLQDEGGFHTNISEVSTQALESGTLATTWAIDTATADTLKVTLQANSNLTTPVYTLSYTVTFNNSYAVTTY